MQMYEVHPHPAHSAPDSVIRNYFRRTLETVITKQPGFYIQSF